MSIAAWIIIGLLLVILALLSFAFFKVSKKLRMLTERRVDVYTAQLDEMNQEMRALRKGHLISKPDGKIAAEMNIIASFPTMRQGSEVHDAFVSLARKRQDEAPQNEISAAVQLAETELVALTVAMREDFALNVSNGRFPNAEIFRGRRDKK